LYKFLFKMEGVAAELASNFSLFDIISCLTLLLLKHVLVVIVADAASA
jgi:hypothetical protein